MVLETTYQNLKNALKNEDPKAFAQLTQAALDEGADPLDLLNRIVGYAKELTAKSWWAGGSEGQSGVSESEALLLSDLIMIGECLQASTALLKPVLIEAGKKSGKGDRIEGKVVLGTIEGDVHDIGKALVTTLFESAGYEVKDVGLDVPAKKFALQAKIAKADIVGISCSMAMAKIGISNVVKELDKVGIRDKTKVIIGGQSTIEQDVGQYGADAWAADATDGLNKTSELMRMLKEQQSK